MGRMRELFGSAPVEDVKAYAAELDADGEDFDHARIRDARSRLPEAIALEVERGMHR